MINKSNRGILIQIRSEMVEGGARIDFSQVCLFFSYLSFSLSFTISIIFCEKTSRRRKREIFSLFPHNKYINKSHYKISISISIYLIFIKIELSLHRT